MRKAATALVLIAMLTGCIPATVDTDVEGKLIDPQAECVFLEYQQEDEPDGPRPPLGIYCREELR